MAELRDGLGGEEVQISGLGTLYDEGYVGAYFIGSVTTESNFSGLNVYASNNIAGATISNTQGTLKSALVASTYGGIVQAGSLLTTAGSQGFVAFGTPFSAATGWYVTLSPCGSATNFNGWYISGARNTSGVNVVGAASLRYDWQAVGL